MHGGIGAAPVAAPPIARAAGALMFYFDKILLPLRLLPIYPRLGPSYFAGLVNWLPALVLLSAGWWLWRQPGSWRRHAIFGLGWSGLSAAPVLGIVPMSYLRISPVADHFAYLSLTGVVGLAAATFGRLAGPVRVGVVAAVAVGLAALSHEYAKVFADPAALWAHNLRINPRAWLAQSNYGNSLLAAGQVGEAIEHLQKAALLAPGEPDVRNNFASALFQAHRYREGDKRAVSGRHQPPDRQRGESGTILA